MCQKSIRWDSEERLVSLFSVELEVAQTEPKQFSSVSELILAAAADLRRFGLLLIYAGKASMT